jgi:hypothetical protein
MIVDPSNRDCTCSRNVRKPLCEENYETAPQTLSVRLRFLTIRIISWVASAGVVTQLLYKRRVFTFDRRFHFQMARDHPDCAVTTRGNGEEDN